jgi:hypothetical protein
MTAYPPATHPEYEEVEIMTWAHSESIRKEVVEDSCSRTTSKEHEMETGHITLGIIPHIMGKARVGQTKILKSLWEEDPAIFLGEQMAPFTVHRFRR